MKSYIYALASKDKRFTLILIDVDNIKFKINFSSKLCSTYVDLVYIFKHKNPFYRHFALKLDVDIYSQTIFKTFPSFHLPLF